MDLPAKLARAAELIGISLNDVTGLNEFSRKKVTCWTLATHFLPHVNTFPLIALLGRMGTGKSQTLHVIANFAYRPVRLSLRAMTGPTIRDKLAGALNGTAIIEEADSAWGDTDTNFERLLSDRYQRATATASHKVPTSNNEWSMKSKAYFGATALHRRIHFKDPALDGRTVFVRFKADHSRQYREFNSQDAGNAEGRDLVAGLELKPVEVARPVGVAGRVFDTYRLLLSAASMCGDPCFVEQMVSKLIHQESLALKEAQASEPDGLVLQAIVEKVLSPCMGPQCMAPQFDNIRFGELTELVWKNHRVSLSPRQVGPIVRELGFETKQSHGLYVVVPTAATLLRVCDECEYTDEAIEELRRATLGKAGGQHE
jgi:hypothetical protein